MRLLAIRACFDSPISDVIWSCYPPADLIKVGTGGNKLAASHIVDNFPEWKLMYELKKLVICPRHAKNSPVCVTKMDPHLISMIRRNFWQSFKKIL